MIWLQLLVKSILDERGFKSSQEETFNPSQLNHFKETEKPQITMVLKQCIQKIHHLSREQKQTRQVSYKKSLLGLFIAFKVLSTSRLNFCT